MQPHIGFRSGMAICNGKAFAVWHGGYYLYDPAITTEFHSKEQINVSGVLLRGKPVGYESLVFLSDRVEGPIQVISIENPNEPQLLYQEVSQGNPDLAVISQNYILWPLG